MKHIYTLLLIMTAAIYGAADVNQAPHTYKGIDITPETIYDLSNQASSLSQDTSDKIYQWVNQPEKRALLEQLLQFRFANPQEFLSKKDRDNQILTQNGLENKSKWNYVFAIPTIDYYIKVAGPINRWQSALMEHNIWPGQAVPAETVQTVLSGETKTYQTASRAAYYLILKELLSKNKALDKINLPDTHILYASNRPKQVHDDNVFIVQRNIPKDAILLKDAKGLPDTTIRQLVQVIIGAGLWNIEDNIFIDNSGSLYLVDLEQPNNSAPKDFFHKSEERYYGNINAGLEQLLNMLSEDKEKLNLVRQLIETNPIIQAEPDNTRYKRELLHMLNQKVPVVHENIPQGKQ